MSRAHFRSSRIAVFTLVLLLAAGAFAVLTAAPAAAATPTARTLKVGTVNLAITTFNPLRITLPDEYLVTYNVYSTLASYDSSYHLQPELASSWTVFNGTIWTVNLVHNAYFTDPTNPSSLAHPVTSADVVLSYQIQMSNPSSVEHAYVGGVSNVTALDSYTVQIVTPKPWAPMTSAFANVPILPAYIWSTVSPMNYQPTYPVGSGVLYYDAANSSISSLLVFHRNPSYYGAADYARFSRPTTVEFVGYASTATLANDFASGTSGLNAADDLDGATYTSATLAPFPRVGSDQGFVGQVSLNVMSTAERSQLVAKGLTQFSSGSNNQLLLSQAVRQAIAMSVDKASLVRWALHGLGDVADSLVPGSDPWHVPIQFGVYPFNTSAARSLLMASGWAYDASGHNATATTVPLYQLVNGVPANPLSFRFYTLNTAPEWQIAANNITAWLAQAGIQTTTSTGTPGFSLFSVNQMSGAWLSGNYDMWLWNWLFNVGSDPSLNILFVETTMAIGPTSDNFYSNATYDTFYNDSLTVVDPVQRATFLNQMQYMVYQYASYILPYYRWNLYAYRNDAPNGNATAWTGWGDWHANPGLAPDSDLPILWETVYPVSQPPPVIFGFPTVQGSAGSPTTITVFANDSDGDPLTYTWAFGDGSGATTTTATTTHTYAAQGAYTVTVTVSDGEWPVRATTTASIGPQANRPPSTPVIQGTSPLFVPANTTVSFTGNSTDPDVNETLTWTWLWGDGLVTTVQTTSAARGVTVSHRWAKPEGYSILLTVSDGQLSATSAPFVVYATGVSLSGAVGSPGQNVSLSGVIVEATKGKWALAFGDGSSLSGTFGVGVLSLTVIHTYTVQGVYTAALTAKIGSTVQSAAAQVVIDGTPPTVVIRAPSRVEATGILTPVFYAVNATDTLDAVIAVSCAPSSGSLFPLGTSVISCQATDQAGNTGRGNTSVTVVDTTPPVVFTPSLVIAEATSSAGAIVNFHVNATDAVGVASGPTCTPASGSLFPLGSTIVRCTATDTSGNVGYGNFTVLVEDTTPPVTHVLSAVDGNGYAVPAFGTTPSSRITFTFNATDAVGVVGFYCFLDNIPFTSCSSPVTYTNVSVGRHAFFVAGVDAAGNYAFLRYNFTVLSPTATIQDLIAKVNALQTAGTLTSKQASTLLAPLNKALTDLGSGKISVAIKDLRTFEGDVTQDISSGILPAADGQPLLNEACDLILTLGGTC